MSNRLPDWNAGTVSLSNNSKIVVGTGTAWTYTDELGNTAQAVSPGDMLIVSGVLIGFIVAVNGPTNLTIAALSTDATWKGATISGAAYQIIRLTPAPTGAALQALNDVLAKGSDTKPLTSLTLDGGGARLKLKQVGAGFSLAAGASGAADAALINALTISTAGVVGGISKSAVGLANVDNTSDANKPVSTAQASAIASKFDKTGGTLTGSIRVTVSVNASVSLDGGSSRQWRMRSLINGATAGSLQMEYTADNFATSLNALQLRSDGTVIAAGALVASTGPLVAQGGDTEGGQITLGFGAGLAKSVTAQSSNTWNIDVDGSQNLRVFSVDGSGAGNTALQASPANTLTGAWLASVADVRAGSVSRILSPQSVFSAAALNTIAFNSIETIDLSTGWNFALAATGNFTLANPTNLKVGQTGMIIITQDATGSRTIAYGSFWKFPSGASKALSTTPNAVDVLYYAVVGSGAIYASLQKAYS